MPSWAMLMIPGEIIMSVGVWGWAEQPLLPCSNSQALEVFRSWQGMEKPILGALLQQG